MRLYDALPWYTPSDGADVIGAVGTGVSADQIGQRGWVFLAQSFRPF